MHGATIKTLIQLFIHLCADLTACSQLQNQHLCREYNKQTNELKQNTTKNTNDDDKKIIITIIIIINKGDTSNNRGEWDYFKVIQKIREQHTRKT